MKMKSALPTTHQICRSLLQKAVRRGYPELVEKVVSHLQSVDDVAWMRQRVVVITYEECWPMAAEWEFSKEVGDISEHLSQVALKVKDKNAAGLGSLAYALSEGDQSVLEGQNRSEPIRRVASGIADPNTYWQWLERQTGSSEGLRFVELAQTGIRKAGWPWDKAFVLAAAFLARQGNLEKPNQVNKHAQGKFPFWVAIDKHTDEGKQVLKETAEKIGVLQRQVLWCSFYFESAKLNESSPSIWWEHEMRWRLGKVGLSIEEGRVIWDKTQTMVQERLQTEAIDLEAHIEAETTPIQKKLF